MITKRQTTFVGLLLLAGVALVWWLARPRGELRLAAADSGAAIGADLQGEIASIFITALSRIDDARNYHKALSFVEDDDTYEEQIPLPRMPDPNRTEIRDLFEGDVSAEGSAEGVSYSLNFKLDEILNKLYEFAGFHDYFVVIRAADHASCTTENDDACLRLVVQYYPSKLPPSEFLGSADTLASDVATLVVRGAVHAHDQIWANETKNTPDASPPYLPALNTGETMVALEKAASGLRVLREGTSHEECVTENACVELAKGYFLKSLEEDSQRNPVGAFGAAVIEFDEALRAARALSPVLSIEQHLRVAENWMRKARRSEFVRSRLGPEFLDPLVLVDIDDAIVANGAEVVTGGFSCAMSEYRRGRWGNCIEKLEGIEGLPRELQPYAEAAVLDSKLQEERTNGDNELFQALSDEMTSVGGASSNNAMRKLVFLKHACDRSTNSDRRKVEEMIDPASTPVPKALWPEGVVYSADCWDDQSYPSSEDFDAAVGKIEEINDPAVKLQYELMLTAPLTRAGKMDAAFERARRAIDLPWSREMLLTAPEFAAMRDHPDFRTLIRESLLQPGLTDLESCAIEGL